MKPKNLKSLLLTVLALAAASLCGCGDRGVGGSTPSKGGGTANGIGAQGGGSGAAVSPVEGQSAPNAVPGR